MIGRGGPIVMPEGDVGGVVLTVAGAGHFVPMDRAGPSLQMLNSFINQLDYSMPSNIDVTYQKYCK